MASDYVGQYGEALKRLTALEQGGYRPVTLGTGQAPSAFDRVSQQPQGPGAFDAPAHRPSAIEMAEGPPMSAAQLWEQMPAEHKDQLLDQIKHVDVDKEYDKMVTSGTIVPTKKNPTKHDKLGYIAEVALRTLSNMGRPGDQGTNAWADAVIDTDSRRGAIAQLEQAKAEAAAERARQEGRADSKEARDNARADAKEGRDRAATAAQEATRFGNEQTLNRERYENDKAIAEIRAKAEAKQQKRNLVYDAQGNAFDSETGEPFMVTTTEHVNGKRGRPGYDKPVKRQLRGTPKFAGGSSMDPDRVVYEANQLAKTLRSDSKAKRAIQAQAEAEGKDFETVLQEVAMARVKAQYEEVGSNFSNSAPGAAPAGGLSPEDQAIVSRYMGGGGR